MDADFCIVATGARNPLRDVGTQLTPPDTMSALGYYVQGNQAQIDIQFLPDLEGYIWIFPRCGHLSVGICGKGEPASALRKRLEAYMAGRGITWKGAAFYSHLLPSLDTEIVEAEPRGGRGLDGGGRRRRTGGPDHRGRPVLRDPLGRPGGAEPARRRRRSGGERARYTGACLRRDFAADLEFGSRLAKRVFLGRFLFGSVPQRMVEFTRRSPRFANVMQDLFAGKQPYLGLKRRLLRNLNGSLYEIAMSLGFSRVVPKAG